MSEEEDSEGKKEEIREKSLDRRLDRRMLRREHRIETIIPEDRFTKTSDFVAAILSGEIIAERITGFGALDRVVTQREPRLFDDRRPFVERQIRREQVVTPTGEQPQTNITDKSDHVVRDYYKLIDSYSRGICAEIAIRSPSANFSVSALIDDARQFDRTYNQFVTLSPQSTLIDAYVSHADSLYILEIGELSWRKECQVILRVTDSITFDNIFVNIKEFLI